MWRYVSYPTRDDLDLVGTFFFGLKIVGMFCRSERLYSQSYLCTMQCGVCFDTKGLCAAATLMKKFFDFTLRPGFEKRTVRSVIQIHMNSHIVYVCSFIYYFISRGLTCTKEMLQAVICYYSIQASASSNCVIHVDSTMLRKITFPQKIWSEQR